MGGHTGGSFGGPNAGSVDAWLARYDGSCSAGSSYCTASTSSIPGCQAAIGASGSPSLGNPAGFMISSGNVPGGGIVGIYFFGENGAASIPFGSLGGQICVQPPFFRSAPKPGGGTAGTCNGAFAFTLQNLISTSPIMVQGASIHAEIWARDPATPTDSCSRTASHSRSAPDARRRPLPLPRAAVRQRVAAWNDGGERAPVRLRTPAPLELSRTSPSDGRFRYCPEPLLAASAWAILLAISAFTASRLKLAPRCMGGKSRKVWSSLPITCCTNTKRQN